MNPVNMNLVNAMSNNLSQFTNQGNKRILWELMTENNIFNNIPDKYANNVKTDFENCLTQMSGNIKPQDSILDLNKQVILNMIKLVEQYKVNEHKVNDHRYKNEVPLTANEASAKKQEKFQRGFETKQAEFNQLIQPPKPTSIDFTDKIDDEPIGSEMDIKLAQTIAWREKQLSQVLEKQDTTAANEWINSNSTNSTSNSTNSTSNSTNSTSNSTNSTSNSNNHIKIGDVTRIDERSLINVKKVNFADTLVESTKKPEANGSQPNFMDKLKKKDGTEELVFIKTEIASIKTELNTLVEQHKLVLENIGKMMEMLNK
jgi:hypothetical protein